jgi:hypothetical protein
MVFERRADPSLFVVSPRPGRPGFGQPAAGAGDEVSPSPRDLPPGENTFTVTDFESSDLEAAELGLGALPPTRTGTLFVGLIAFGITVFANRLFDHRFVARGSVVAFAILCTAMIARRLAPRHPDEPWLARTLVWGVVAKLIASILRYRTLSDTYGNVGDAPIYDRFGRRFVKFWTGEGPEPFLVDLRKSNFVRYFTGIVYYLFGTDMIAGFMVFGLIAFVGSYLWYRAATVAIPFIDRRLWLFVLLFAPSILFWPSSIGKEALMQFGIGSAALGTALIMTGRLTRGVAVAAPGAWLLWVVRPHLLGLVSFAAAVAYVIGRRGRPADGSSSFWKPVGVVVLVVVAFFGIGQGAKGLGIQSLSLDSINAELEETSESTGQGGSSFDPGDTSISPASLPRGMLTVFFRPFPWEVESAVQVLAALECVALLAFVVHRRRSVLMSLRSLRRYPFLLYCWTLTFLYALTFQAFANFGLLVRQRSLVLPALYVIVCLHAERGERRSPFDGWPPASTEDAYGAAPYGYRE